MIIRMNVTRLRFLFGSGIIAAASLQTLSALPPQDPSASSTAPQASSSPSFTVIDGPGAGTGADQGTAAVYINAAGAVAGAYLDANNVEHGFVRSANGAYSIFETTNAGILSGQNPAIPIGIDSAGDVAGLYTDDNKVFHGFFFSASGNLTTFSAPGAGSGYRQGTYPTCINASGVVAGIYDDSSNIGHAFIRSATGTFTQFDAATNHGIQTKDNPGTYITSINSAGSVAGTYIDSQSVLHGFVRSSAGAITLFSAPNAGTAVNQGTAAVTIDAAGDIGGIYADASGKLHAFIRTANGTITPFNAPGAGTGTAQGTYPWVFDAAGDLAGDYVDASNVVHGFVRSSSGNISTFSAPGATASAILRKSSRIHFGQFARSTHKGNHLTDRLRTVFSKTGLPTSDLFALPLLASVASSNSVAGTTGYAINATGDIVGLYSDGDEVSHGFLRSSTGTITSITAPKAGSEVQQGTGSLAINASKTIVGTYTDSNSVFHGFIATLAEAATTTTLNSAQASTVYGEPVTLTAKVASGSTVPPNGETVSFLNGTATLGSGTLSGGTATLTTTALPVGSDSLKAVYSGDTSFAGSTSSSITQTVAKAGSTTTLVSSLNPSNAGQSVTFHVTVAGQFGGVATGSAGFTSGSTSLGAASLSANAASISTTALPVGTNSISASYGGDSNFNSSKSNTVSQVVKSTLTKPVITWRTPAAIPYGTALSATQLNATASVAGSFTYLPAAGTVLPAGAPLLTVTFKPTNSSAYSTATANVTLTVNKAPLTVTANNASRAYGASNPTFTAAFKGFVNGDTSAHAVTGAPSLSTIATSKSAPGTYPITITQGALAAANYSFQFVNGTLTVTALGATANPVFHPGAETSNTAVTVTVTDATSGAIFYYTANGTAPTTSSPQFPSAGLKVTATETLTVIAVAPGYNPSAPVPAKYTIATAPSVTTTAATAINTSKATLNATVTANNATTQYWFAYGTSKTALTSTTAKTGSLTGTTATAVSAALTALKTKTTYYFQVVASNAVGTTSGTVLSFATN